MHRTRVSGFTLVELMVTIAIVAILLAIGLPSFQGALRSNRVATAANELVATMALARSEAVRSAVASGICATSDGTTCGTDWNAGWLVWADVDGGGDKDAAEAVVRHVQGHPRLGLTAAVSSGGASTTTILFDARGRPDNPGAVRTWELSPDECPAGTELVRNFSLSGIGQFTMQREACP